ncbi:hypothetical protein K4Q81_09985, partial [Staphylococcus epidermidis]|nr:hypothetical protein [Staphylococcus epidermidis]
KNTERRQSDKSLCFYPFRFFRKIYFLVLARSHAPSKMVLLTSLIAYARGIKLFLYGYASRKTFNAGTLAHALDDLLQWLCNTAKINKFFLKENFWRLSL